MYNQHSEQIESSFAYLDPAANSVPNRWYAFQSQYQTFQKIGYNLSNVIIIDAHTFFYYDNNCKKAVAAT